MILVLVGLFIIICYRWGGWRNWQLYYPTILFLIAGDFISCFVSSSKPLWKYQETLVSGAITQLLVALLVYPCTVLIFFYFYKYRRRHTALYLLLWVSIYSLLEYLGVKFHYFSYYNGWNFSYSVILDVIIFSLLIIHQKWPLAALLGSFITGLAITFIFELPL